MKQEFTVMEAAFNLIDSAESNQKQLQHLLSQIDSATSLLRSKSHTIDSTISDAITRSSNQSANEISKKIMHDLSKANSLAMEASEVLHTASKKSFKLLLTTQLAFLALSVFVLWFFFMRDIPTREEFLELRSMAEELHKYGDVYDCGDKKCVEVEGPSRYSVPKTRATLYNIKPRHH